MSIRITGVLLDQARRYITTDGAALLFARVQPPTGSEVLVRWMRGIGPAAHLAAAATARELARGVRVTVHCTGLRANTAAPAQLFAEEVTLVEWLDAARSAQRFSPESAQQ